jgi:hypothetical protein
MARGRQRSMVVVGSALTIVAMTAGASFAHECVVVNKPATAGAHVTFNEVTGDLVASTSLQKRIDNLGMDAVEERYKGVIGLDFDGDGVADASTFTLGTPTGSIPDAAMFNGSDCNGVVHYTALEGCMTEGE